MLAKLIAWAPARPTPPRACSPAPWTAPGFTVPPPTAACWPACCATPTSLAGRADTSLLDGYDLAGLAPSEQACLLSATAAALAGAAANRAAARAAAGLPGGWRNVVSQPQRAAFDGPRGRIEVAYLWQRDGTSVVPPGTAAGTVAAGAEPGAAPGHALLEVTGVRYRFDVAGPATWSGWTPRSAASR